MKLSSKVVCKLFEAVNCRCATFERQARRREHARSRCKGWFPGARSGRLQTGRPFELEEVSCEPHDAGGRQQHKIAGALDRLSEAHTHMGASCLSALEDAPHGPASMRTGDGQRLPPLALHRPSCGPHRCRWSVYRWAGRPPPSRRQQSRMLRRVSDQVTRGKDRRGLEVKILTLKGIRDCGRRWVKEERTGSWTLPEQKSMPGAVQVVGGAPLWEPCFARLFVLYL